MSTDQIISTAFKALFIGLVLFAIASSLGIIRTACIIKARGYKLLAIAEGFFFLSITLFAIRQLELMFTAIVISFVFTQLGVGTLMTKEDRIRTILVTKRSFLQRSLGIIPEPVMEQLMRNDSTKHSSGNSKILADVVGFFLVQPELFSIWKEEKYFFQHC